MPGEWHCVSNGQQVGPVSVEQLRQMAASGQLAADDLVWEQSMPQWVPAAQAPQLKDLFPAGSVPYATPTAVLPYSGPSMTEVAVTGRAMQAFRQTKLWVRFMAILLLVFAGLMVVGGLIVGLVPHGPGAVAIVYIPVGLLFYLVPGILLNRYATNLTALTKMRRSSDLEAAVEAERSFWKYCGILTIVIIGLYILAIPIFALLAIR